MTPQETHDFLFNFVKSTLKLDPYNPPQFDCAAEAIKILEAEVGTVPPYEFDQLINALQAPAVLPTQRILNQIQEARAVLIIRKFIADFHAQIDPSTITTDMVKKCIQTLDGMGAKGNKRKPLDMLNNPAGYKIKDLVELLEDFMSNIRGEIHAVWEEKHMEHFMDSLSSTDMTPVERVRCRL